MNAHIDDAVERKALAIWADEERTLTLVEAAIDIGDLTATERVAYLYVLLNRAWRPLHNLPDHGEALADATAAMIELRRLATKASNIIDDAIQAEAQSIIEGHYK